MAESDSAPSSLEERLFRARQDLEALGDAYAAEYSELGGLLEGLASGRLHLAEWARITAETFRTRMNELLTPHRERAEELVASLRRSAAELFEIPCALPPCAVAASAAIWPAAWSRPWRLPTGRSRGPWPNGRRTRRASPPNSDACAPLRGRLLSCRDSLWKPGSLAFSRRFPSSRASERDFG